MTEEQARAACERLAASHPDRETHRWLPRRSSGGWEVVKISLAPPPEDLTAEQRAEPRPSTADDPRPAAFRNIPPYGPAG